MKQTYEIRKQDGGPPGRIVIRAEQLAAYLAKGWEVVSSHVEAEIDEPAPEIDQGYGTPLDEADSEED